MTGVGVIKNTRKWALCLILDYADSQIKLNVLYSFQSAHRVIVYPFSYLWVIIDSKLRFVDYTCFESPSIHRKIENLATLKTWGLIENTRNSCLAWTEVRRSSSSFAAVSLGVDILKVRFFHKNYGSTVLFLFRFIY